MDVVGYLTKQPGPEQRQNEAPMTSRVAHDFAERLRRLGYTVRVVRSATAELIKAEREAGLICPCGHGEHRPSQHPAFAKTAK